MKPRDIAVFGAYAKGKIIDLGNKLRALCPSLVALLPRQEPPLLLCSCNSKREIVVFRTVGVRAQGCFVCLTPTAQIPADPAQNTNPFYLNPSSSKDLYKQSLMSFQTIPLFLQQLPDKQSSPLLSMGIVYTKPSFHLPWGIQELFKGEVHTVLGKQGWMLTAQTLQSAFS